MNKACFMVLYGPLETDARVLRSIGVFNAIKKPVTIFTCNTRPGYEAGDNVEIVNVALKVGMLGYLYFCLRVFLYFLFNLRKFDLVYLQDFYSTVPGLLFHPFCRKKRIIYDAHELILPKDGEELSFRDKVFVKAEKKLCKKVFYTIEANQEREDIFKERYNLENVSHVLNISKLSFSAIKRELHEDNITLVYQGVVAKERRLSFFVQCLAKLPDRYKMMIIGDGDALNELKECVEKLIAVSDSLRKLFSGQQPTVEPQPEADPPKQISFEELRGIMAKKTRVSKANTDAIRDLLTKFGAHRLSELKPEQYAEFLKEAEVIPDA